MRDIIVFPIPTEHGEIEFWQSVGHFNPPHQSTASMRFGKLSICGFPFKMNWFSIFSISTSFKSVARKGFPRFHLSAKSPNFKKNLRKSVFVVLRMETCGDFGFIAHSGFSQRISQHHVSSAGMGIKMSGVFRHQGQGFRTTSIFIAQPIVKSIAEEPYI
jgi:hypothetical protein